MFCSFNFEKKLLQKGLKTFCHLLFSLACVHVCAQVLSVYICVCTCYILSCVMAKHNFECPNLSLYTFFPGLGFSSQHASCLCCLQAHSITRRKAAGSKLRSRCLYSKQCSYPLQPSLQPLIKLLERNLSHMDPTSLAIIKPKLGELRKCTYINRQISQDYFI